jgi:TolB-like protein
VPRPLAAESGVNAIISRSSRAADRHSSPGWLRPVLLAAVLIVVAGAAYVLFERFVPPKRAAPALPIGEKSIAVLPFVDLSEKHDQEYFADGMAEEILDILARVPSLKVIGRTSSFQFKGRTEDLRTVGSTLGVGYVLEGSVRKSVDRVRVTAQLSDTRDGVHVWSQTYDRAASDALLMQGEIATSLARSLEIGIGADHPESERRVKNDAAYDLYLRGRYAAERGDADGLATGVAYLRQALDADPTFADAAVALALTYYNQAFLSQEPSDGRHLIPSIGKGLAKIPTFRAKRAKLTAAVRVLLGLRSPLQRR